MTRLGGIKMKLEIEFSEVEIMLLQQILTDNADTLATSWEVSSLSDLVHLLSMHGADHSADLVSTQCEGGEGIYL